MEVVSYKCPNCGGALTFDAEKQKFDCKYCYSEFTEEQLLERYSAMDEALGDNENDRAEKARSDEPQSRQDNIHNENEGYAGYGNDREEQKDGAQETEGEKTDDSFEREAVYYTCPSCGAEIVTTETTAATECFYCHNPVVLAGRLSGDFKPDYVIPFEISREKAMEEFPKVCKKKKFLPIGFWNKKQIDKITGVYFPYWYADDETYVNATARCESIRSWTVGDSRYTETKIFQVFREGDAEIQNMIRGALSKEDAFLLKHVHPYDLSKLRDFSMAYLSGYQAEKRDIEKENLKADIDGEARMRCENLIRSTIKGYTTVQIQNMAADLRKRKWKYTLLPVWMVTYRYLGKIYVYGMNGQTGKIYGELPLSKRRLAAAALIIGLVILALGALGGMII